MSKLKYLRLLLIFIDCTLNERGKERERKRERDELNIRNYSWTSRSSAISIACDYIANEFLYLMYILFTTVPSLIYYIQH